MTAKQPDYKMLEQKVKKLEKELEKQVKEHTQKLQIQKVSFEETNAALKVLLKKKEREKKDIEDDVLTNVKRLILPYIKKMKKTKLDDRQKAFLSIIESNIDEIISPFSRRMSIKESNLTPKEIQIANLIMQGATSKKIGEIMEISPRTVDAHRKNIRKKIGLQQKRANLRSYLLSLH
jgi:DNA-binding CsgD family transcriptional regulator